MVAPQKTLFLLLLIANQILLLACSTIVLLIVRPSPVPEDFGSEIRRKYF
jgi:hypothetical protein